VENIEMPHLTSFIGPGSILEALALGPCLNDALIRWPDEIDVPAYESALRALRPCAQHMSRLSCSQSWWDIRLLPLIAKHLPTLPNLRFHVLVCDQLEIDGTLESCLSRMTALTRFVLAQARYEPLTIEKCDRDLRSIRTWGKLCPTLTSFHLPSGTIWLRLDNVLWIPTNREPLVSQWWSGIVLSGALDEPIEASDWFINGENTLLERRGVLIRTHAELSAARSSI